MALVCCSVHSLGSNITPKYLYNVTGYIRDVVTEPSGLGLSKLRAPGIISWYDLGKFISPILEILKGELCVRDHSKPPFGHSIISFSISWHCPSESPITSIIELSTKPGDNLSQEEAVLIRGVVKAEMWHRGWVTLSGAVVKGNGVGDEVIKLQLHGLACKHQWAITLSTFDLNTTRTHPRVLFAVISLAPGVIYLASFWYLFVSCSIQHHRFCCHCQEIV